MNDQKLAKIFIGAFHDTIMEMIEKQNALASLLGVDMSHSNAWVTHSLTITLAKQMASSVKPDKTSEMLEATISELTTRYVKYCNIIKEKKNAAA